MREAADNNAAALKVIGPGITVVAATYGLSRYTYGLFIPDFRAAFGLSTDWLGLIASSSYASYLAATLLGSWLSSHTGPRLPIVLGGGCAALGMFLIALASSPAWLALGVIVAGASPGLSYPPLPDAVIQLVSQRQQSRTYTIINSGTSLGVVLAGPLALWAGQQWRLAWAGFAVFATATTIWNIYVMPSGGVRHASSGLPRLRWRWLIKPQSHRLFLAALALGLVTSVYWTFAVEYLVSAGTTDNSARILASVGLPANALPQAFWILIGVAGFAGAFAGDLVTQLGLRWSYRATVSLIALAIAVLAATPTYPPGVLISALVFGGTFIVATALLGVWSVNVFYDRPSIGFGTTFFLLSLGQLISPAIAGVAAERVGLAPTFWVAAGCGLAMLALQPREDIRGMTPEAEDAAVQVETQY